MMMMKRRSLTILLIVTAIALFTPLTVAVVDASDSTQSQSPPGHSSGEQAQEQEHEHEQASANLQWMRSMDEVSELVLDSRDVWSVLIYASDESKCPAEQCEAMLRLFEEAADLSKNVVKFGVIDLASEQLADKNNKHAKKQLEMLRTDMGVSQIPDVRMFSEPGVFSSYSNRMWRPWKPIKAPRHLSSAKDLLRATKKLLQPCTNVEVIQGIENSDTTKQNKEKEEDSGNRKSESDLVTLRKRANEKESPVPTVLFLGSKEDKPAPMICALGNHLQGRAEVGYINAGTGTESGIDSDSDQSSDIAKSLYQELVLSSSSSSSSSSSHAATLQSKSPKDLVPGVLVFLPESSTTTTGTDTTTTTPQFLSLKDIHQESSQQHPIDAVRTWLTSFISLDPVKSSSASATQDKHKSKPTPEDRRTLQSFLRGKEDYQRQVLWATMPTIVAYRLQRPNLTNPNLEGSTQGSSSELQHNFPDADWLSYTKKARYAGFNAYVALCDVKDGEPNAEQASSSSSSSSSENSNDAVVPWWCPSDMKNMLKKKKKLLLKQKKKDEDVDTIQNEAIWAYRVFAYDDREIDDKKEDPDEKRFLDVTDLEDAKKEAMSFLPSAVDVLGSTEAYGRWVSEVFSTSKGKQLPVLLFAKQEKTPIYLRSAAAALSSIARFALVPNADIEQLESAGIITRPDMKTLPLLLAFVPGGEGVVADETGNVDVSISMFQKDMFGKMAFPSVYTWITSVMRDTNPKVYEDFAKKTVASLHAKDSSDHSAQSNSDEAVSSSKNRRDITSLTPETWKQGCTGKQPGNAMCLLLFYPEAMDEKEVTNELTKALESAETVLDLRVFVAPPVCFPNFARKLFGIDPDAPLSIVAFHPSKSLQGRMIGSFAAPKISQWISKLHQGKGFTKVSVDPDILPEKSQCAEHEFSKSSSSTTNVDEL